MPEVVANYAVGAFVEPQNGESPIDADAVRLNDNTVRTGFNNHDAEPAIHFQGSSLAARPAAGAAGRKWFTSDTKQIFRDNGTSWDEIDYLNKTNGGTVAGATTFSGGLTSTAGSRTFGATTFTGTVSGTSASFSSTISSAGATFTGAVSGTSASFSSTISAAGMTLTGALSGTTGAFTGLIFTTLSSGKVFGATSGTTNSMYVEVQNTGSDAAFGVANSAGGVPYTNARAYATFIGNFANNPLDFVTNGVRRGGFSSVGVFDVVATTATVMLSSTGGTGKAWQFNSQPDGKLAVRDNSTFGEIAFFDASVPAFHPSVTNAVDTGTGALRWRTGYFVNVDVSGGVSEIRSAAVVSLGAVANGASATIFSLAGLGAGLWHVSAWGVDAAGLLVYASGLAHSDGSAVAASTFSGAGTGLTFAMSGANVQVMNGGGVARTLKASYMRLGS